MNVETISHTLINSWRHNGLNGVSNHQHHNCLLSRLFGRRSKKTSKLRVNVRGIRPVNSPHKWPVTRKMFPFDDVIMYVINANIRCRTPSARIEQATIGHPFPPSARHLNKNYILHQLNIYMMTLSNGNIFRVTGHLCGEFTGHRWIPRTKASDAELWCFLWSASE